MMRLFLDFTRKIYRSPLVFGSFAFPTKSALLTTEF